MYFENLDVWQHSRKLASEVFIEFRTLKDFVFRDQVCRSILSVPSNVAEGVERTSYAEKVRFLTIAKASLAEFITQIYIGGDIGYVNANVAKKWRIEAKRIAAMIGALQKSFKAHYPTP